MTSIVSQSERSPSETHTSKVWVPTWPAVGVQVKAPPAVMRGARGHRCRASVKVSASPASGSVAVAVKASSLPAWRSCRPPGRARGRRWRRGHDHVDRLAVGEVAVGDAHVEGVGSDLAGGGRPGEGAAGGDARRPRAPCRAGSVKVSASPASGSVAVAVKASSLPAVAVLSPTGSRTGAALAARHDHVDRLAVGEIAVGDAHVEGVGSDLAGGGRPGEGAAGGDRGARGHRAGCRGEREGERVAGRDRSRSR